VEVDVLLVKDFFEDKSCLGFEVVTDLIIILRIHQLSELFENVQALARVELLFALLKTHYLKEQRHKLVYAWTPVNVDVEESLERFEASCKLVHRRVMNRVSPHHAVLLRKNLAISGNYILRVLIKQTVQP